MSLEIVVGRKSGGQIVVDRNTWNLGWMQATSNHLSWQGKCKWGRSSLSLLPSSRDVHLATLLASHASKSCWAMVYVWGPQGMGNKTRGSWRQFWPLTIQTQIPFAPFQPPQNDEILKLLWYEFTCLGVLPTCFSSPFSLTASLLHAPATPTCGERFPSQLICIIFCGLSVCRRPLSPKPRHLYPAVVPTYTRSFHNICHSKWCTTFVSTPQMSWALQTLHSCSIFCHCLPGHQAVPGGPAT